MDVKKPGGILGLMTGAAAVTPDEAEAAVYSKDGRRLLNLLDKASKGALPMTEPVFEFQERLPKDMFKAAREDNGAFHTRKLAADRNDIQHYWNARHGHMSNEEIEDLVESLTTGQNRFYVRANKPYAESVGVLGSSTGGRGALRPSEEVTYLHQVNPLSNKRLLNMKSRAWETPDGSAFHPDTSHSPEGGATQRAFSADGVSDDSNIPAMDALRKGLPPLFAGGAGAAALAPGEAQAAQKGESGDDAPWRNVMDEITRGLGLGTRNVLEGLGRGATLGLSDPGKTISDFFGLPVPETDLEKRMAFLEGGAAEAVSMLFGGGAFRLTAFLMIVFRELRLSDTDVFSKGMRCACGACFPGKAQAARRMRRERRRKQPPLRAFFLRSMCAGRSARRFCFRRSFSRAVPVVGGPEKGRLSGRRGVPSPCTFVNGALRKVPLPEGGGENAGRDCLGRRDREESMCFYSGRLLRQLPRGLRASSCSVVCGRKGCGKDARRRPSCAAGPCPARLGEKRGEVMLELSQGVRGACLGGAGGVWDYVTEEGVFSRLQDVTDIIRQNKEAQNAQKCGFQKAPTFRRVASIPIAVVDIAAAQGLDILNDPEAMRKFLNDPDNRAFRTTLERV